MIKTCWILSLLVLILVNTANVSNINHQFIPEYERQYSQYLQFMLGLNTNTHKSSLNSKIQSIIEKDRMSLFNAVHKIILVLSENNKVLNENKKLWNGHHLKNIVAYLEIINQTELQKRKQQLKQFPIHYITGTSQQLKSIKQIASSTIRKLQTNNQPKKNDEDPQFKSYITKFFFILMFIIVSFSSLWAIAFMENRKDTLLYAKFIADVGR